MGKQRCLKSKVLIRSFNDSPLFIRGNNSTHLNHVLFKPILKVGKSKLIRPDNSSKFIVKHLQTWFRQVGIEPIQISKRLPWGNGYHEGFDGKLRHEFKCRMVQIRPSSANRMHCLAQAASQSEAVTSSACNGRGIVSENCC